MDTIATYSNRYSFLCPVKAWDHTVKRFWSIPGIYKTWMVYQLGKWERVQYANVRDFFKKLVLNIREENLGIRTDDSVTHSN